MHLSLIRLIRKKLNELPRTTRFTELYELTHVALDLVLAQHKLNKIHHESIDQVWRENRKLYADLQLLASFLKIVFSVQEVAATYQKSSEPEPLPPNIQEAINKVLSMDYNTAYGIPVENPQEDKK